MDRSQLIIIIPAFNEENSIKQVVENVISKGDVLVVNDASSDQTESLAKAAGAHVVTNKTNLGYDGALNSGFDWALQNNKQYAITFDADGQHDAKLIDSFIEEFHKGKEIVLGVRPQKARVAESIIGYYFRYRFGIHDILCGMKGYDLKWVKKNGGFDHINSIGSELCHYAIKNDAPFSELHIPLHPREDKPRFGNLISSNLKIFKALFKIILMDFKLLSNTTGD